jgi:hypothetical protein
LSLGEDAEIALQPLMGGLPPEIGWASLRLFESDVLPALVEAGRVDPAPAGGPW